MSTQNRLIEDNYDRMIRVMRTKHMTSKLELEDIDHCVHIGLVKAAQTFNPKKSKFYTHAYKRCNGEILDLMRKIYGRSGPKYKPKKILRYIDIHKLKLFPDLKKSEEELVDDRDEAINIINLAYNPEWIKMLKLHYLEGYTTNEIAKMFNKPQGTVWDNLFRARKYIKRELGIA